MLIRIHLKEWFWFEGIFLLFLSQLGSNFGRKMTFWISCQHIFGQKCFYGQAANIFLGEKWYMGRLPKKYRLGPKTKQPRIRGDAIDLFVIFPSIQDLLAECHLLFFKSTACDQN